MNKLITTLAFFLIAMHTHGQNTNPAYNKTLADSLGADDYGMKPYVLVILKTGANTAADNAQKDSLFKGHMKNIYKLAHDGMLVVSGPIKENKKNYEEVNGILFHINWLMKPKLLQLLKPGFDGYSK